MWTSARNCSLYKLIEYYISLFFAHNFLLDKELQKISPVVLNFFLFFFCSFGQGVAVALPIYFATQRWVDNLQKNYELWWHDSVKIMARFSLFRLHRLQIHWEKQSSLIKAVFQIKPIYWSRQSQLSSVFRSLCFKVYICSIFWLQHYYHIFMGSGQRSVSGLCLISFRTKLLLTLAVFLCIHHSKLVFILLRKLIVWFVYLCQQVAGIQIGDTFWFCRTTRRYSCRYVECFLSFIIKEWNAVLFVHWECIFL